MLVLKPFWDYLFVTVLLSLVHVRCEATENVTINKVLELMSPSIQIESFHIFTKIRYRFGQTKVICTIRNHDEHEAQEAVFAMDLPQEAFVSNFTIEVNGQKYRSLIKEKVHANSEYSRAREQGNTAAIINNEEKNLFNINITVEANATAIIYLEYEEEIIKVTNGNGHYQYAVSVIPQVIEVNHFCVDVDIVEFKDISIKSLNLCTEHGVCVDIDMQNEAVLLKLNRGVRIIYEPSVEKMNKLLRLGLLGKYKINYEFSKDEPLNEVLIRNGYFVHRFYPDNLPTIPIHVIFVVDISESMIGERMKQMSNAMLKILNDLKPHDFFNIITFSTESKIWWPIQHMEPEKFQHFPAYSAGDFIFTSLAKFFIKNLTFHGSTNIYAALMDALELARSSSLTTRIRQKSKKQTVEYKSPTPMIFFMTDGAATSGIIDANEILKKVRESNTMSAPIFSLAFGSTADYSLLQAISSQNYGISRRVFDDFEAEIQLKDFYDFVASPVLKNLTFQYTSSLLEMSEVTNSHVNWLPLKSEVTLAGRIAENHLLASHGVEINIMSSIVLAEGYKTKFEFKARICPCGLCPSSKRNETRTFLPLHNEQGLFCEDSKHLEDLFVERFWVHKMLKDLIRQAIQKDNITVTQRILELSVKYNLVTPFTSLLIITPFNDKKPDNREYYNAPSISNLLYRDRNKNGVSLFSLTRPKHLSSMIKMKNYSATDPLNSSLKNIPFNNTEEPVSMVSYLQTLITEQKETVRNSRIFRNLTLHDIEWLHNLDNKLTLMNRSINVTYTFQVVSSLENEQKSFPICRRNNTEGRCTHLLSCVETEIMEDLWEPVVFNWMLEVELGPYNDLPDFLFTNKKNLFAFS